MRQGERFHVMSRDVLRALIIIFTSFAFKKPASSQVVLRLCVKIKLLNKIISITYCYSFSPGGSMLGLFLTLIVFLNSIHGKNQEFHFNLCFIPALKHMMSFCVFISLLFHFWLFSG